MTGKHDDLYRMAADLIEQQNASDTAATTRTPPDGPETAVLTTAEVRTLVKMLRRILTPAQRKDAAAELGEPD